MRRNKLHGENIHHSGFLMAALPQEEALKYQEMFTFKEAMKSKHETNFIHEIEHETNNHTSRKHWKHLTMSEVPCDQMLRSTCTFSMKCYQSTGDMIKFKATFCSDGQSQELRINYDETCVLVIKWNTIRISITLSIINNWKIRAIDFDQTCPQADCDTDMRLHLPAGFKINSSQRCVAKLLKNIYGIKTRGCIFCEKLCSALTGPKRNFIPSRSDPGVFARKEQLSYAAWMITSCSPNVIS